MAAPTTPILDTASRADGGPPPGVGWGSAPLLADSWGMLIAARALRAAGEGGCSAYWAAPCGGDQEVHATIVSVSGYARLYLGMVRPGTDRASGYRLQAPWYGDGLWRIARITDELPTDLATARATGEPAPGDRLLFRRLGSTLTGSWLTGGRWVEVITTRDTTYTGASVIGCGADWDNTTFRDFGGGATGATIAHFDGSAWTDCPLAIYDGAAWRQAAGLTVL